MTESTAVLNQWTEYCCGLYNYEAYSRATSPPHKRLKACLCREKRLKRLCAIKEQESLQEWTTFSLSIRRVLNMTAMSNISVAKTKKEKKKKKNELVNK